MAFLSRVVARQHCRQGRGTWRAVPGTLSAAEKCPVPRRWRPAAWYLRIPARTGMGGQGAKRPQPHAMIHRYSYSARAIRYEAGTQALPQAPSRLAGYSYVLRTPYRQGSVSERDRRNGNGASCSRRARTPVNVRIDSRSDGRNHEASTTVAGNGYPDRASRTANFHEFNASCDGIEPGRSLARSCSRDG